jgi:hypothetical protein
MKLLKVEDHNYSIIYINDNENYNVYRRINAITWEIFRRNEWKPVTDCIELEKTFNERDITKTYTK